jgi:isocitrate dehydrogenase (NAD+)
LIAGKFEVTLIPGDGIGQETSRAVKAIFKYENVPIDFEEIDVHGIGDEPGARELFAQSMESLKRNRVGLKGINWKSVINGKASYTLPWKDQDIRVGTSL